MNRETVDRVADAVLYEGYILYPYRPSVKNRQRWTFGGLYPPAYCEARRAGEASSNQTECLVRGGPDTVFEAVARFLHLTDRRVGEFVPPLPEWSDGGLPPLRFVESLQAGGNLYHAWQEAEKREVGVEGLTLGELAAGHGGRPFRFLGGGRSEPVHGSGGEVAGVIIREQQTIEGAVDAAAVQVADDLYRVTFRVVNHTPTDGSGMGRDEGLLHSLVAAHSFLGVRGGEFVSLIDPPECCRDAAAGCRNVGVWPVLVGEDGSRDTMLSSPIILYDYPQIAPESAGDFFDATEIDEMLTLRIMTMTDDEKRDMAAVDGRAAALLAWTEARAREQLARLHGTMRDIRPGEGPPHG
jgi:hydrogenase maturation protease